MQLKLLTVLGALAPIVSAQNNSISAQNTAASIQNGTTIIINDNLVDIITAFPRCSLTCFSDAIHLNRCRVKDFDCVCHWAFVLTDNLRPCMAKKCQGVHNDARARLWDFCHRWDDKPPAAEIAAAKILMRKRIVDPDDWMDRPRGGDSILVEPDMAVMGAAVAAAAALMI
ncbi:hypothetical protein F4814DRAFT_451933 [Daldinia grandis]|nr:hypothetical protein F4814DRAFT_451933 [Daldinia grandis]